MASAWGLSWSSAWGSAWGAISAVTEAVKSAGGGTSQAKRKKQRLILLERLEEAEQLIEQAEELIKAEPKLKGVKQPAKPSIKAIETPQVAVDWLRYYIALLETLRDRQRAEALQRQFMRNMQILLKLIEYQRDEEEALILLMAA